MKVFVTGGTGYIGASVVAKLVGRGHHVRCLVRPASDVQRLKPMGVDLVEADLGDRPGLRGGMEGCECAIHLAALRSEWERNKRDYFAANVEGTRNVMEFALHTKLSKVVHVSDVLVWGARKGQFDENTPVAKRRIGPYAETKFRGELVAWQLRQRHRLPLVVVYPATVIGPGARNLAGELVRRVADGKLSAWTFPRATLTCVCLDDVAEAIVRAAEEEGNVGGRYIVGREAVSLAQLGRWAAEAAGAPLPKRVIPTPFALALAAVSSLRARVSGSPPAGGMAFSAARRLALAERGFLPDGSRAERELGIRYSPVRAAVVEAVRAYKGQREPGREKTPLTPE